jgi:hypothetical protein
MGNYELVMIMLYAAKRPQLVGVADVLWKLAYHLRPNEPMNRWSKSGAMKRLSEALQYRKVLCLFSRPRKTGKNHGNTTVSAAN